MLALRQRRPFGGQIVAGREMDGDRCRPRKAAPEGQLTLVEKMKRVDGIVARATPSQHTHPRA
ncbi:hypothetical protein RPHASCH2410_CH02310 [Rhizobium phaseoli Ch24-10]|nr:hypothetical protein RPHASCH2410_CH02310 [Rhizobium phaseoli Ch24-10]